jgi:cell division septation protein DedD
MSDEGFHEIQLNGKQLVFLFMAATVVSVVIFLCGVMVGRGVRAERGPETVVDAATALPPTAAPETATPPPANPGPARPAGSATPPAAVVEPPPPADDGPVDRPGTTDATPPSAATPPTTKSASPGSDKSPAAMAVPAATKPTTAPLGPVDQSGWAVQVSATKDRGEADAMAHQLVAKGYQAYVLAPGPKGAPMFKVQIGRFKTRQEAEKTAARVKKEGKYKPWITR